VQYSQTVRSTHMPSNTANVSTMSSSIETYNVVKYLNFVLFASSMDWFSIGFVPTCYIQSNGFEKITRSWETIT